ncbi:MAG TPA: hypothetical protein VGD61_01500 [Pyrinomonadaceae bacterium]
MSLSQLLIYLAGGFIAGLVSWSSMENKYQKALNKTHKAPPDPRLRIALIEPPQPGDFRIRRP